MKAAIMDGGEVLEVCILDGDARAKIAELTERYAVGQAIASVVGREPEWDKILPVEVRNHLHRLSYRSLLPISIDYETPETLGMDRVAAVVGARQLCSEGPLVVVDAGSCITVDFLDAKDCYRGGAILPGIAMRLRALKEFTAALPLVELSDSEWRGDCTSPLLGRSTRASIVSGVLNASVFEIQGFIEAYKKENPSVKLFLTGGNAEFFAKQLFFPNFANSSLMYIGLNKILEMNNV
ncbi:MAG: type III pantothenate kinase [Bacteroidales bacterium]|nr:type III pantothenate kinase [Bacteroidales bacterium]